ncbi:MAG: SH3 domain-containing protein [Methylophagaceae bacterium]
MSQRIYILLFQSLLLVSITGCAVSPTYINDANLSEGGTDSAHLNPVHYKMQESFRTTPPQCIAILPLIHHSEKPPNSKNPQLTEERLEQLRWSLYSQLAPYSFRDVELANVNKALKSVGNATNYAEIGKTMDCDALLLSEVTDYQSGFFGVYSQNSIGIKMKLIRSENEEVLWEGSHVAKSHGGSIPLSPIGLVEGLYSAKENMSDEQLVRVKDDVFRRLLSTWDVDDELIDAAIQVVESETENVQQNKEQLLLSYVSVHSLWLRSGPGRKFSRKGVLKQKDQLEVLDNTYSPWVQVKAASGQLGYVNSKYINSF